MVVTSTAVADELSERVRGTALAGHLEVVGREAPSLRDTLDLLRRDRGLASICIEAGPSSSLGLYEAPLAIDELMLSVYQGAQIAPAARGGSFPSLLLTESFDERHRTSVDEASGPWSFRRWLRRPL
jgi:hypothetical protein